MHGLINCIVRVIHALDGREGIVKVCLLQPLAVSVDVVQAAVGVHRYEVRRYAYVGSILAVEIVQPEMAVAFEAVVELDPGCDGCEERAIDAAEGRDEAIVEGIGEGLSKVRLWCSRLLEHFPECV